jgi:mono/diheme cytochrome c family protein
VVGAIVLPTLAGALLALLPWIDRGPSRDPRSRPVIMTAILAGVVSVVTLTALGARDRPADAGAPERWTLREIAGATLARGGQCVRCHQEAGLADPLDGAPATRGPEWIAGHVADPEVIAPGVRQPPTAVSEREVAAIVAYVHRLSRGAYPGFDARTETAASVFARYCIGCHLLDGEGGKDGPELSRVGGKHDAATLRRWITDPSSVDAEAEMPAFGRRLMSQELDAIAAYLAGRK